MTKPLDELTKTLDPELVARAKKRATESLKMIDDFRKMMENPEEIVVSAENFERILNIIDSEADLPPMSEEKRRYLLAPADEKKPK